MQQDIQNLIKLHSRETVIVWEIIGSYFVNRIYNQYYSLAIQQYNNGAHNSVTDAYMAIVSSYIRWFEVQDNSRTEIENIVEFYNNHKGTMLLFADFEEVFAKTIVPKEYMSYCSDRHKDNILYTILHDSLAEFIRFICGSRRLIKNIVDDHTNTSNVRELQDLFISIIADQKHHTYAKISTAADNSKATGNEITDKYTKLIKNMHKTLDECNIKISELQSEVDTSKRVIKGLVSKITELISQMESRDKLIKELQSRPQPMSQPQQWTQPTSRPQPTSHSQPRPTQSAMPKLEIMSKYIQPSYKSLSESVESSESSSSYSTTKTRESAATTTDDESTSTSSEIVKESTPLPQPQAQPSPPSPPVARKGDPTSSDYWGDDF